MGGGLFWRCETKLKRFSLEIGTVLCPRLGEDQKKKVFTQAEIDFCDLILFKPKVQVVTFSLPMKYLAITPSPPWLSYRLE